MKVITEKRLRELLKLSYFNPSQDREQNLLEILINVAKEIDTLTVSKLRPMCG